MCNTVDNSTISYFKSVLHRHERALLIQKTLNNSSILRKYFIEI